jgi:hypothetical protein
METNPERTRALIGVVLDELLATAAALLETAKEGMTELVLSGYGVDPAGFYTEVMRLLDLRLRSIGFIDE